MGDKRSRELDDALLDGVVGGIRFPHRNEGKDEEEFAVGNNGTRTYGLVGKLLKDEGTLSAGGFLGV